MWHASIGALDAATIANTARENASVGSREDDAAWTELGCSAARARSSAAIGSAHKNGRGTPDACGAHRGAFGGSGARNMPPRREAVVE